jgi:hypothetical protein
MKNLTVKDFVILVVIASISAMAWKDNEYGANYFAIASNVVTGYFALSIPRQN